MRTSSGVNVAAKDIDGTTLRATYRFPPFGVEKLVETVRVNIHRVHVIWELAAGHLTMVANAEHSKLRAYGVDAMEEMVRLSLSSDSYHKGKITEHALISSLCDLCSSSVHHTDTKIRALEALHRIISACGQTLKSSWPKIITCLQTVVTDATTEEKCTVSEEAMHASFKVLNLIIDEYLVFILRENPVEALHLKLLLCVS